MVSRKFPDWKISFSRLGKIGPAEVQFKPLTILVGKNNTGKSYLASLLWAVLSTDDFLFSRNSNRFPAGRAVPKWFVEACCAPNTSENETFSILKSKFADWYNAEFEKNADRLLASLFSWSGSGLTDFRLTFPRGSRIDVTREHDKDKESDAQASLGIGWEGERNDISINYSLKGEEDFFKSFIFEGIVSVLMNPGNPRFSQSEPVYFPAARTGFVLALQEIIAGLFDNLEVNHERERSNALPLPLVRFLRALSSRQDKPAKVRPTSRIADFLEKAIIAGHIEKADKAVPEFEYVPKDTNHRIPLRASSSMITELAPFLYLLRAADLTSGIVFEEPEAHLHISAQREMARAIVRLVNMGVPVVLTTHSDTFLQQINLLISLHAKERRLDSKYEDDDILSPNDVIAYELLDKGSDTEVKEAALTKYGFVVPSVNEVLNDISAEVLEIQG